MIDKKKVYQLASPKETPVDNISASAQRSRLLARLTLGPIDTLTARRELNCLQPAARIKELKERGYSILTERITTTDDQGRTHRGIARYHLITLAE